jgi:hypothetical protein
MITFNYTVALYSFAYGIVNLAEQDNMRYAYGECLDCNIGTDSFQDDICRALAVDRNAKQVYGF